MFEELLKRMEQLNGQRVEIKIPLDENNFYDRKCPNETCRSYFKVKFEDWRNIVRDEVVYCPVCKFESPATEWHTEEQFEYIKSVTMNAIKAEIAEAMYLDAKRFNSRQKNGFINISLSYKPGRIVLPISPEVMQELAHNYQCSSCTCRYSYFGTAFFCPSCGIENVEGNIHESIRNIRLFLAKEEKLKESYNETMTEQETESIFAQIAESNFCKVVSVFQRYSETLFESLPGSVGIATRKNLFQNLQESSGKWKELTGSSYEDIFEQEKYNRFKEYFQIRHLLSHTGGFVDQSFIDKAGARYRIGQRVVLNRSMIEDFTNITDEFISVMRDKFKK